MLNKDTLSLINDLGQTVTLKKVATGAYTVSTGTVAATTTEYTVKAYIADYTLSELNAEFVVRGDRKAILPAFDTSSVALPAPDEGDKISGVGDEVRIVSVQTIYEGSTVVCYICQVRE